MYIHTWTKICVLFYTKGDRLREKIRLSVTESKRLSIWSQLQIKNSNRKQPSQFVFCHLCLKVDNSASRSDICRPVTIFSQSLNRRLSSVFHWLIVTWRSCIDLWKKKGTCMSPLKLSKGTLTACTWLGFRVPFMTFFMSYSLFISFSLLPWLSLMSYTHHSHWWHFHVLWVPSAPGEDLFYMGAFKINWTEFLYIYTCEI